MSLKELAMKLATDPAAANELQLEINKAKSQMNRLKPGALSKAGSPVVEPIVETQASKALFELSEKKHFDPDAECMEYKGSKQNEIFVRSQIAAKFGDDHAEEYQPTIQVRPKTAWLQAGYVLREGEEPLCHITTWRKGTPYSVALFHQLQMIKA